MEGSIPSFNISPKLRKELIELAAILKGNTVFPQQIRNAPTSEYLCDREFYAQQFLIGVREVFSKTKNDERTYQKAFQLLIGIAGENGYPYLTDKIAEVRDYVLRSDLPEDNLWRSYDLPKRAPKRVQNIAVPSMVTGIGKFVSWIWSIILHDRVFQLFLVVLASIVAFVICYIEYPNATISFFSKYFPWIHLK